MPAERRCTTWSCSVPPGCPPKWWRSAPAWSTVQAYEYTGGLTPGDPAHPQGAPLSARFGTGAARRHLRRAAAPSGRQRRLAAARGRWAGRAGTHLAVHAAGRGRHHRGGGGPTRRPGRDGPRAGARSRAAALQRRPGMDRACRGVRTGCGAGRGKRDRGACHEYVARPSATAGTGAGRRAGSAQHRPTGSRPAVSRGPRKHGGRPRRVRYRKDDPVAADRQVVRRGRDRLRGLWGARE